MPYDGGGIATSVRATRAASDDAAARPASRPGSREMRAQGTTTVEIKSGYGLTVADEARALRIARRAHRRDDVPGRARRAGGVRRPARATTSTWSPARCSRACAPHARWVDVFCEPHSAHAFTEDEARGSSPPAATPVWGCACTATSSAPGPACGSPSSYGAASVDHCTYLSDGDVDALGAAGTTVATLLPGVEFSTRSPYPDARRLLDAGVSIALATDCNPGTCYSSSMPFVLALAVREMRLTPGEALRAATVGSATSLRRNDIGRIAPGMRADLTVLDAPSYLHLSYRAGVPIARALELAPN